MAKAYKHYTIVDRLAGELLTLLGEHLSALDFQRDRLVLHMLLTVSQGWYVNQLLFRAFDTAPEEQWCVYRGVDGRGHPRNEHIHTQAFSYVEELLVRPLTLANNLNERPTNMHLLLATLCRYGPDRRWQRTAIGRDRRQGPAGEEREFFRPVALELAGKRAKLGEQFSDIARNRRRDYGPLWLTVEDCAAEVPEELSLEDVLAILPKPLAPAFTEDMEVQRTLARVLAALNERYGLLRSCGLDPEHWLARPAPSINQLKDLKQLRKHARALCAADETQPLRQAYYRAFNALRGERKHFAGYSNFDDFSDSEIGRTLLQHFDTSLDESCPDEHGQEERSWSETLPASADVEEAVQFAHQLQRISQTHPELSADPVARYCFYEVIEQGRGWYGPEGVLQDPAFQRLIRADPRYAGRCESELAKPLWQCLERLIKQALAHGSG